MTKIYTTDVSHVYPGFFYEDRYWDLTTRDHNMRLEDDEDGTSTGEIRPTVFFTGLQDIIDIASSSSKIITDVQFQVYFYYESSTGLDPSDRYPYVHVGEKEISSSPTSIWGSAQTNTQLRPPQWASWSILEGLNTWIATGVDNESILKLLIFPDEVSSGERSTFSAYAPNDETYYIRLVVTYEEKEGSTAFNLSANF